MYMGRERFLNELRNRNCNVVYAYPYNTACDVASIFLYHEITGDVARSLINIQWIVYFVNFCLLYTVVNFFRNYT